MVRIVPGVDLPEDAGLQRLVTGGRGALSRILGDADCRQRLLGGSIHWDRVLIALEQGRPVGFAAFKYRGRGPFALRPMPFFREFGPLCGLWRFALFLVTELREWRYAFLLHGLKVRLGARNRGIGSALLAGVLRQARMHACKRVSLEVHERNERALRLYLRQGFSADRQPLLRRLFGWPKLYTLSRPVQ